MRGAALLALLLLGSAPTPPTRTLYFARPYDPFRWCGYATKAAQAAALESSHGGEAVRATYVAGRISRLTYETDPESGDWVVVDTYRVSGGRLWLERAIGISAGGIQIVERGSAPIGRRIKLSLVSAKRSDGTRPSPGGWYDPQVAVARDLETLPFAALGRTMLRRGVPTLCK